MSVTININGLTLCHKGSNGVSTATVPDVCKTPTPGGPVPIPYPNIAMSSDLAKGTTTISADGGNMCAIQGSELSKSTGDEPGTIGGVTSNTFAKEASWITFSFDVKFEGKGVCRLTDKMFHNHQNTVDCAGLIQKFLTLVGGDIKKACEMLLERIEQLIGQGKRGKVNGIRGLEERFEQQIKGGGQGADGAPNAPSDRGPNPQIKLYPNGSNSWQRHDNEISEQQKQLDNALDEYDERCKGGPPPPPNAREWARKKRPQPQDWQGPVWSPPVVPIPILLPEAVEATEALEVGAAVVEGAEAFEAADLLWLLIFAL